MRLRVRLAREDRARGGRRALYDLLIAESRPAEKDLLCRVLVSPITGGG